jgi:uncharacterized membrane protein YdjX (TVP38/TMEM64 family)
MAGRLGERDIGGGSGGVGHYRGMVKQLSRGLQTSRRPALIFAAVASLLMLLGVGWRLLPLGELLAELRGWIGGLGVWGVALFALIYIVGAVVLLPAGLLSIVAGFAYGFWGLPLVVVAATIGAALAFLIARYAARDRVQHWLLGRRKLAAIDRAVAEDGWKIVALLRLSPAVPFNLQNYLFGVTAVPFTDFVVATFFGIIPGAALFTYVGVLGGEAADAGPVRWALFAAGLAATAAAAVLIARKARARLAEAGIAENGAHE